MPEFARLETKDKEDGVDDVGLAVAVGSDYAVEMLVEGAESVLSAVGFEVDHLELVDDHG